MQHKEIMRRALVTICLFSVALPLSAKRAAPPVVDPIVHNHIKYSAESDGKTAYVVASDAATGKEVWRVEIFQVRIKPELEEDVQWVFITKIELEGETLLVENEKSRCYLLDLQTRHVSRTRCP